MSFRRWAAGQIRYPDKARRKKIAGRVVVRFAIEPDGRLDSIEIIESPHPSLAAEVERVLRTPLRWTPATSGGRPVRAKYTVPFVFQLPESPK